MKPWEKDFKILKKASSKAFAGWSYFIVSKQTDEVIFPKTRQYGYSTYQDACRGAAQLFNSIEKSLLRGINEDL